MYFALMLMLRSLACPEEWRIPSPVRAVVAFKQRSVFALTAIARLLLSFAKH